MASGESDLRFAVDDVVLCNMGSGNWVAGRVTALNATSGGKVAPYQITLDSGDVVVAPVDDPRIVREASAEDVRQLRRKAAFAADVNAKCQRLHHAHLDEAKRLRESSPDVSSVLSFHAVSSHIKPGKYAKVTFNQY